MYAKQNLCRNMLTWDLTSGRQFSLSVQYIFWLHILLYSQEYGTHTLVLLRHGEFGKLEYWEAEGTRAIFLKAWTNLRNSSWNWGKLDVCLWDGWNSTLSKLELVVFHGIGHERLKQKVEALCDSSFVRNISQACWATNALGSLWMAILFHTVARLD